MEFKKNLKDKDYFLLACFAEDLQEFYKKWVEQSRGRIQFFEKISLERGVYEHIYWRPSKICRASGKELSKEEMTIHTSYWTPFSCYPIHKDLAQEYRRQEAFECQVIDTSCNDCYFFSREKANNGKCLKFDNDITVYPNTCQPQNDDCFEHRQTHRE